MNTKSAPSFRSALGRVRGLGSAKEGTAHWWMLRMTSIILIPLSLYALFTFISLAALGGYDGALFWLDSPFNAVLMIVFLLAAFHHAASGLQEVIEDYIHCEYTKIATLLAVRFGAAVFVVYGILAVLSIQLQELTPHAK